jgi:Flp pilus assembly pilin Flp
MSKQLVLAHLKFKQRGLTVVEYVLGGVGLAVAIAAVFLGFGDEIAAKLSEILG